MKQISERNVQKTRKTKNQRESFNKRLREMGASLFIKKNKITRWHKHLLEYCNAETLKST